jgi:putative methionine-R-sulfoxide reductase with GAF domain
VPILEGTRLRGVLDIDAPERSRFDEGDRAGLELFVETLVPLVHWSSLLGS